MPPEPIQVSGEHVDLSPRFYFSQAVAGSPALAAETIICTLTVTGNLAVVKGVLLEGAFSFTAGTSATSAGIRIRQTGLAGTTVYNSGLNTVTAASLYTFGVQGVDTAPVLPGQVYVLTLIVTAGAAVSTVSAATLTATVF